MRSQVNWVGPPNHVELYLEVLRKRFPLREEVPSEQREQLEREISRAQSGSKAAPPDSIELQQNFPQHASEVGPDVGDRPVAGGGGLDRSGEVAGPGLRDGPARMESDARVASKMEMERAFELEQFAQRCQAAHLGREVDDFVSRLQALERLASLGFSSEGAAAVALKNEHARAVATVAWVLSAQFYSLIARLRSNQRAGGEFTPSDFNEAGKRLARAMNGRIFGGRPVLVAEPHGVQADDALHSFENGSAGQPMQPCSFRVTDGEGKTTHRARITPQSGSFG